MARQGKRHMSQRDNVAASMLRQHIVRAPRRRAANDNTGPTSHTFKGVLLWSAIIAVTALLAWGQYRSWAP